MQNNFLTSLIGLLILVLITISVYSFAEHVYYCCIIIIPPNPLDAPISETHPLTPLAIQQIPDWIVK